MVVNSFRFFAFFAVVFIVYFIPRISCSNKRQNGWLLLTSYFFYGFVDWRMLPLLLGVTLLFFFIGKAIHTTVQQGCSKIASMLTTLGVSAGIGILLYFKYLNFFAESFAAALHHWGLGVSWTGLNIVLPVGVSFFTFKLISYVIEIHREKIVPSYDFIEFATYISFFPTILSGPIDRPGSFLPQLQQERHFDYNLAMDGCQQILWGIFTKMVIADRLAIVTDTAWSDFSAQDPWRLLYAALLSPVQVYADFDGYSNMAIGVGKILGFRITKNFDHPLLARNVSEYWRRWHISLTGWITDYVFMPLNIAFRNLGKTGLFLAVSINIILIGMWHGANWTYAVFGVYHSLLFLPLIMSGSFGKNKKLKEGRWGLPRWSDIAGIILTYLLIAFGHIIFFSADVPAAFDYISKTISLTGPFVSPFASAGKGVWLWVLILFILDWRTRKKEFAIQRTSGNYQYAKVRLFLSDWALAICIVLLGTHGEDKFIYFQF